MLDVLLMGLFFGIFLLLCGGMAELLQMDQAKDKFMISGLSVMVVCAIGLAVDGEVNKEVTQNEKEEVIQGEEKEVVYKDIEEGLEITKVRVIEGTEFGGEVNGIVEIEYELKDGEGFLRVRRGFVKEENLKVGDKYRIIEEYVKEDLERTGNLKEVIVKKGSE